jgi:hypothetical protein
MLSPCPIWLETGQKVVVDGEVNFGLLPAAMAAGVQWAGVTEGSEGGAGSLQGDDVVLLVPSVGVKRPCTGGSTGGRAAAELGLRRHCGPAIPVKETGIGSLGELRRVAGVLFVLRIGNGEQRWWRRSGEGGELGEEGMLWPGVLGGVKQFAEQQLNTP